MRKPLFALLGVVGLAFCAQAQANVACGNGRYSSNVFPAAPTTTTGVTFGYNTSRNYASGVNTPVTLKLDVYEPAGDVAGQRPLLILAFGGAFVQGSRTDPDIVAICQEFAHKGYVTAAIDYRLIENDGANYFAIQQNPNYLTDEVIRAVADLKAAVRFFKHDAAITHAYRIDPTKIFVGGFSAGAIAALEAGYTDSITENPATTAAYNDNGGLEGNTDLTGTDSLLPAYDASGIAGVFNIAGGVNNRSIVNAGNPPLFSAQGDNDQTVPYDCGTIQYTSFTICGSHQLQLQATAVAA
ncbi:MAG: alpha/beta hydrolase, partial [Hymenobacter sp.]